ncbi:hypothetical protein MSG28_005219 [Choristoneura fumiferana]|uniref:Uncharacterized protein n=1 Tax=Choristoneura fumiferana TaxID=7141 RepID=A0ACC0JQC2_CHOFU|nr:hypothetical protein MSG28_005219 [Choristoneura fumiferana]
MHIKRGLIPITRRPMPATPEQRPLRHPARPPYIYLPANTESDILLPAPLENHQHQPKFNKMMKLVVIMSALVAIAVAKPSVVAAPLVAAAPAPIVTATSSQYYHRINNGLAAYVAAPAAYVASAPYVAAAAPYVASPYVSAPYVSAPYVASPYSAPIVAL